MKTSLRNRLRALYNFFALIPGHPVTWKERRSVGTEEGVPRPISDREFARCPYRILQINYVDVDVESKISLCRSRSRSQVNSKFVMSRCSRAGTAKKCTKKRDARAELLFCSLNLLLFLRFRCPNRTAVESSWFRLRLWHRLVSVGFRPLS